MADPSPPVRPRDRLDRLTRPVRRAVLRRRRPLAALLAAVAVATGLQAVTAPAPPGTVVLVAARDLPAGVVLAADDLRRASYAAGTAPTGAATTPVGRTLAAPLRRGEPVTDVRLVGPGLARGHPGLVAVPVRIPDAGMVALLRAGDRIDLVAADPQGSGARVVAEDVPVLALPAAQADETGPAGALTGRLVVVGLPAAEVTPLAEAAARDFLSLTLKG
jgi:Flp pilus assembly protein CpaB